MTTAPLLHAHDIYIYTYIYIGCYALHHICIQISTHTISVVSTPVTPILRINSHCEAEYLKIKDQADLDSYTASTTRVSLTDLLKDRAQPVVFKHMYLDTEKTQTDLPMPGWPERTYTDHITKGFHGTFYDYHEGEEIFSDWGALAVWVAWDIKKALCSETKKQQPHQTL